MTFENIFHFINIPSLLSSSFASLRSHHHHHPDACSSEDSVDVCNYISVFASVYVPPDIPVFHDSRQLYIYEWLHMFILCRTSPHHHHHYYYQVNKHDDWYIALGTQIRRKKYSFKRVFIELPGACIAMKISFPKLDFLKTNNKL